MFFQKFTMKEKTNAIIMFVCIAKTRQPSIHAAKDNSKIETSTSTIVFCFRFLELTMLTDCQGHKLVLNKCNYQSLATSLDYMQNNVNNIAIFLKVHLFKKKECCEFFPSQF